MANPFEPYNKCLDPTHVRSPINGRCSTCRSIATKLRRQSSNLTGRPRRSPTVQGKPCRTCGGTERYENTNSCTACQRKHGSSRFASNTTVYHLPVEFIQWVKSPAPESVLCE